MIDFKVTRTDRPMSLNEILFEEALDKLHNNHHQLTKEEEEFILNVAKRIIDGRKK